MSEQGCKWFAVVGWLLAGSFCGLFIASSIRETQLQSVVATLQRTNERSQEENTSNLGRCKTELTITKQRMIMLRESQFERDSNVRTTFKSCEFADDLYVCTGATFFDAPVRFHCDVDGCHLDCGAVK